MKRILIVFMTLGLLVGAVATAEAKKEKRRIERTVEASYGPYPAPATGCNEPLGAWACASISTRENEAFFTAKVTDAHGLPVFVEVRDGMGSYAFFCGETTDPIAFEPGATLQFHVALNNWLVSTHCPAHRVKTTGTISVTLSNMAKALPVRSGTIVTGDGWFVENDVGGCQMAPECATWLQSGCHPLLAEQDPAVSASIENIERLADAGIERVYEFGSGEPGGVVWGGTVVQFWTDDCTEIRSDRWRSTDCDGDGSGRDCRRTRFLIPERAEWMTVTSGPDNANVVWTLT